MGVLHVNMKNESTIKEYEMIISDMQYFNIFVLRNYKSAAYFSNMIHFQV